MGTAEELLGQVATMLDEQHSDEREVRQMAREARREASEDRIGAMRTAADFAFAAGVAQGVAQAASGTCQAIGTAQATGVTGDDAVNDMLGGADGGGAPQGASPAPGLEGAEGLSAPPPQQQPISNNTRVEAGMEAAKRIQSEWGAYGQLSQAAGTVASSTLNFISKSNEADAELHQARVQSTSDAAADANDAMAETRQAKQKALQHLEATLQGQIDSNRAAIIPA